MRAFIAPRANPYAYLMENDDEHKKQKGQRNV